MTTLVYFRILNHVEKFAYPEIAHGLIRIWFHHLWECQFKIYIVHIHLPQSKNYSLNPHEKNWSNIQCTRCRWYLPQSVGFMLKIYFRKENWCVYLPWILQERPQWKHLHQEVPSDLLNNHQFWNLMNPMTSSKSHHQCTDVFRIRSKRSFSDTVLHNNAKDNKILFQKHFQIVNDKKFNLIPNRYYSSFSGLAISLAAEFFLTDLKTFI